MDKRWYEDHGGYFCLPRAVRYDDRLTTHTTLLRIEKGAPAAVPVARTIAEHQANPEYAGRIWAVVPIDLAELSGKAERVNITLPACVRRRIDRDAQAVWETRSDFIARRMLAA